jgi:hypothetical protein
MRRSKINRVRASHSLCFQDILIRRCGKCEFFQFNHLSMPVASRELQFCQMLKTFEPSFFYFISGKSGVKSLP